MYLNFIKYLKFVLANITPSNGSSESFATFLERIFFFFNFVTLVADVSGDLAGIYRLAPVATVGELDEGRMPLYTACPRSSRMSVGKIKKYQEVLLAFVIYKSHMDIIDYSLIEREILAVLK